MVSLMVSNALTGLQGETNADERDTAGKNPHTGRYTVPLRDNKDEESLHWFLSQVDTTPR